jgi:hypothetical protein
VNPESTSSDGYIYFLEAANLIGEASTMKAKPFRKHHTTRWVQPVRRGYLFACCDCALVHRMDFRIVSDPSGYQQKVQFRVGRHEGQTKALRKR